MIFTLNFHEFLHTMYKYVLNSVVKISLMFAQYFEYYAIILRGGGIFSWTRGSLGYHAALIHVDLFSYFNTRPARDRQTDRRTDGIAISVGYRCAIIISLRNNKNNQP